MKKLFLILLALPLFGQTTYTSSKYKPVWYNSTYEKTHGTYALFDTSSIKLQWTTSGKPEMKFFGPTGNTLFYLDSTGTISTGTTSGGLLKADFDDSLNNAHTITGEWKFNGNVGVIPASSVSIGKNAGHGYLKLSASDGDTTILCNNGTYTLLTSKNNLSFAIVGATSLNWTGVTLYAGNDACRIGADSFKLQKILMSDSLLLGGKSQDATIWWGQSRQSTASDSCGLLTMSSGNPVLSLYATNGSQSQVTVNTSDQMLFQNASGGYAFDSYGSFTGGVVINNTAVAPTAISGRMYFQGINNADADTLFFYNGTAWKQFISE